ncbi:MAG: hypothetical protein NC548_32380 [Lachnospiraceae bacterium]|nr:hypothetical protein [Lachnospiraceae bacterium]
MIKLDTRTKTDVQYYMLKKISEKLSSKLGIKLCDIEEFVLKQDYGKALLYIEHPELFVFDFEKHMEIKMGVDRPSREDSLRRRILGPL